MFNVSKYYKKTKIIIENKLQLKDINNNVVNFFIIGAVGRIYNIEYYRGEKDDETGSHVFYLKYDKSNNPHPMLVFDDNYYEEGCWIDYSTYVDNRLYDTDIYVGIEDTCGFFIYERR